MSIWFDEVWAIGSVGVVSEFGFDAGLREVLRCARFVLAVEFARILGSEAVQAALVGLLKTHAIGRRWGTAIDWWG
jgi:hypothetical protein